MKKTEINEMIFDIAIQTYDEMLKSFVDDEYEKSLDVITMLHNTIITFVGMLSDNEIITHDTMHNIVTATFETYKKQLSKMV